MMRRHTSNNDSVIKNKLQVDTFICDVTFQFLNKFNTSI